MLKIIGAHAIGKRTQMMLLRKQCLRSRTFFDKHISLLVTELGDVIFVLWVNSSERQARQVSVDGLGRMVARRVRMCPADVGLIVPTYP